MKMKRLFVSIICLILLTGQFSISVFAAKTEPYVDEEQASKFKSIGAGSAKPYYSAEGTWDKVEIGNKSFYAESSYNGHYNIYMKKNGVRKTIAADTASTFVTNGLFLFYSKIGKYVDNAGGIKRYKQTIYRININTGKKKRIASGTAFTPLACSGNTWLYAGVSNGYDGGGYNLYAVNIKTGAKRLMKKIAIKPQYESGKVLVGSSHSDAGNAPYYIFNKNGTGKTKIGDAARARIKGKYIYYAVMNHNQSNYTIKYKVFRCNLQGKNKKAVTGWLNSFPSSYFE